MPSFSWRAVTVSRAPIILGDLKDRDLVFLARIGRFRNLASGEVLIRAGEPIHSLFCIMEGSFSVSGADGQAIATLSEGEIVGEMSFFERRPPNVSVKAKVAARVMELARAPIVAKLDDDNAFAARFYRALGMSLSYRLRRASSKVEELDENLQESLIRADNHYVRLIRLLDGG